MDSVGARIQGLPSTDQVLSIARLAEGRSRCNRFVPGDIDALFDEVSLPRPAKVTNQLASLERGGLVARASVARGLPNWQLTPRGRQRSQSLASDMELASFLAQEARVPLTLLGKTAHPVVPPSLAPPELISPLRAFLDRHPFETNVFGMTRYPKTGESAQLDPIASAIDVAREVCADHGLQFHLASDRQIVDDLWPNVAAHLWGSRYAVAFFENRTGLGLNYNLSIEVGSCLALGRRLLILKDSPVERLPTDLVGHIYREVDLSDTQSVEAQLHAWARDDLSLGECSKGRVTP